VPCPQFRLTTRCTARAALLAAFAGGIAAPATASEHSLPTLQPGIPIELNADSSDFDYDSSRLVFRGLELEQGDLQIKADLAETNKLDFADGEWNFSGNVSVRSATASLFCDAATLRFVNHQLASAELTGSPARFEQRVEDTGKTNTGEAGRMLYRLDNGILELQQNARFADGTNEISGDAITYDVVGRHLSAGSGASGPVKILIEPPAQDQKANGVQ
jgi:lipopolysaccharide transport protein LptA